MQEYFADMIGRTVDMLTPGFIHKSIRQRMIDESLVLYDAGVERSSDG